MKTRVLWVAPHERALKCGEVYDLPEAFAGELIQRGEAEALAKGDKTPAQPDPRPQPEPEPAPPAEA